MRNRCGNLWRFFGILFVLSGTFIVCQTTSSQSNGTASDPAPSQSDTVTIIKEIHASEKRILDEIHTLDKDVAVLKTRLDIIQWSLAIIGQREIYSKSLLFIMLMVYSGRAKVV